ncbi:MAG: hypothetical protein IPJ94_28085 [Chloroflexi bacterium]|nr:hypothetical protein [Chloroflexota bacterium]
MTRPAYKSGLQLFTLTLILTFIQPAPLLVTPGPLQTVQTNHPLLGVHTRLTDEVEEWKIKHTLELVREMGASSIVEFSPGPTTPPPMAVSPAAIRTR